MDLKRKATSTLAAVTSSPSSKKLKQGSLTSFFGSPKSSGVHTAAIPRFDKEAWIKGLTPSQKDLLKFDLIFRVLIHRLEIETLHDSWLAVLKDELTKDYFLKVFCIQG